MNATTCLRTADGYLLAAKALYTTQKNGVAFLKYYISPFTVNAAFSCEVYLKYLYYKQNGTAIKGQHNLFVLYGMICEETQSQLKSEYERWTSILSLEECLQLHSKAFVNWRYIYEDDGSSVEPQSLYNLAVSLHNICHLKEEAQTHAH